MSFSAPQQTEVEKPVTRTVYFVQFDFATAPVYLCSANITIPWNGHDWLGLGSIGGIGTLDESEGVQARSLNFTLNVAQSSYLSLAIGSVAEYRGLAATMYYCPLDENFLLVGTPQKCWGGMMDIMAIGIDKDAGSITLKCETSAYGLKRRPALRINAAQQKKKYPADTGFDLLVDLIANPTIWTSAKFQRSVN